MEQDKLTETTVLLKKIWVVFLIGLYGACFINEHQFPGFRNTPLEGEEILWKIQRVLFFGLMGMGFLIDVVESRIDRSRAFKFLLISLVLGGLSNVIGVFQYKVVSFLTGIEPIGPEG